MLVKLAGSVIVVRLVQLAKAYSPMLVTPSGSVIVVRLPQPKKTWSPMLVTGRSSIFEGISHVSAFPV